MPFDHAHAVPWSRLLDEARLRRPASARSSMRGPFQQDADLVVFSAAFRRLQDKTQVHPLSARGKVRTRLTHSIEVASVGRSLGTGVGLTLHARGELSREQAESVAHVVYAACLAHDIGNPPFGHGGEDALGSWFRDRPAVLEGLSAVERADLCRFEGNAQGLRILTQLENYQGDGGLRLTHATLGGFMKYTVGATEVRRDGPAPARKPGFFESERAYVRELREGLGLRDSLRHPLAYLMEAADDICYAIIDVEDGHAMDLLGHAEALEALEALADCKADARLPAHAQLQKLRGIGIGRMIGESIATFLDVEQGLRSGGHSRPLLDDVPSAAALSAAKALAARQLFRAPSVQQLQDEGRDALHELLSRHVPRALEAADAPASAPPMARDGTPGELPGFCPSPGMERAACLRHLVDCLSALTDEHAVSLSKSLA